MSSLLILLFSALPVFTHLTTEDGLSQNTVLSIAQDSDHNMWFATMDAVDKYDGYHFSSYQFNSTELPGERKESLDLLFTDSKGRVYVNAEKLYRYDKVADRFAAVEQAEARLIADSLCRIQAMKKTFLDERGITGVGKISDMARTGDVLWFATTEGGVIGIGDLGKGRIIRWSLQTPGRNICSNNVRSVCYDGNGRIWAGTGNGLSLIDINDYSVINLQQSADRPDGLGNNMIKDIFLDDAGGIWVGSFYGGVDYCHRQPLEFFNVDIGLKEEVIGDIEEDSRGRLWIGTGRNGIFRWDPAKKTVNRLNLYENNPEYDDVKSIVFSGDGKRVYVGTGLGGVIVLDYRTDKVVVHPGESCPKAVYSILEEDDRYLWVGSLTGLYLYDTKTGDAIFVNTGKDGPNSIFSIVRRQRDSSVLIGGSNGLISCKLSIENGKPQISGIRNYEKISLVQDILPVGDDIWAATRKGLFKIEESGQQIEISGLPCKLVRGLERDDRGNIWAGTENGLCSISSGNGRIARYGKSDGLAVNSFSLYAHITTSDGKIYFGGIGGLASFFPRNEVVDEVSRKPSVSSIVVDGEIQKNTENGIVLSADKKVIDLYFAVPNYSSLHRNVFYYRLKNSSNVWSEAGPSAQVSFSSLKPGRYVFELKSENSYGVSSDEIYSLPIRVMPPWYLSVVAFIVYILAGAIAVTISLIRLARRVTAAKDKEIERIKALSQEEIIKLKLKQYCGKILSAEDEAFLMKVYKIVSEYMDDESFRVEVLASELCMTRGNLHIKMKKITGDSAIKFIQKVRFDKACELLKNTDLPVAEVGAQVGFSSPAYFTSSFKRFVGVLPARYRK